MEALQKALNSAGLAPKDFPKFQAPTTQTPHAGKKPGKKGNDHKPAPVIAMARVGLGNRPGELVFYGPLVPGVDRNRHLRNRVVAPNRDCPKWFLDECQRIAENYEDKRVRIKISHTVGDVMAFAIPCTTSLEQLNNEWNRYVADQEARPKTLKDCAGLASGLALIYETAAGDFPILRSVTRSEESYVAIVAGNGVIWKYTGAEKVWAMREEIIEGKVTLEKAINTHLRSEKVTSVRMLPFETRKEQHPNIINRDKKVPAPVKKQTPPVVAEEEVATQTAAPVEEQVESTTAGFACDVETEATQTAASEPVAE